MTDIPVLRPEDMVVLRTNADDKSYENIYLNASAEHIDGDYRGTIAIGREIKMPGCDPDRVYRRYEMPARVHVSRSGRDDTVPGHARYSAAASHYQTSDRSALRTLANMVKSGDSVTINFLIGNSSDTLTDAGLTHDECYLTVYRRKGTSNTWKVIGDVYVDDIVAPVDSSARMGYR